MGGDQEIGRAPARRYPLDFWLSLLAGEQVWSDEAAKPAPLVRLISLAEVCCFAWIVSSMWLGYLGHEDDLTGVLMFAPHVGTIAALTLSSRPLGLLGGQPRPATFVWSIIWRTAMASVLAAAVVVVAPGAGWFALLPLGMVFGFEAAMSAWSLGIPVRARQWVLDFFRSLVHLVVLVAAVVTAIAGRADVAVLGYAVFVGCVGLACATAATVDNLRELQRGEDARLVRATRRSAHREIAHWLHDDVSAHLGLVKLKLQDRAVGASDVARDLDELDHLIRMQQLEELYQSGDVRLAEVLQPHVRRAQHRDVMIDRVPSFEEASLQVGVGVGRQFGRAAAVLTSNAMNAGATPPRLRRRARRRAHPADRERRRRRLRPRRRPGRPGPLVPRAGARRRVADRHADPERQRRHVTIPREAPCRPS